MPRLLGGTIDYNDGALTLFFDETMDVTPGNTLVDKTKVFLNDVIGDQLMPLTTATLASSTDAVSVNFTLTEALRVQAISLSGTSGYSGLLTVETDVGAFSDMGQNTLPAFVNISLIETADTTAPLLLSATLDFNDGILL